MGIANAVARSAFLSQVDEELCFACEDCLDHCQFNALSLDLVAQVDEELSNRPDSLNLWSQRINLLMDLQNLYENRLRREYRQVASL